METLVRRPTAKVVKRKKRYVRSIEASMEGTLLGCGPMVGVIGPFGSRTASAKKFCAVFPRGRKGRANPWAPEGGLGPEPAGFLSTGFRAQY